jgi:hypothetical protein
VTLRDHPTPPVPGSASPWPVSRWPLRGERHLCHWIVPGRLRVRGKPRNFAERRETERPAEPSGGPR